MSSTLPSSSLPSPAVCLPSTIDQRRSGDRLSLPPLPHSRSIASISFATSREQKDLLPDERLLRIAVEENLFSACMNNKKKFVVDVVVWEDDLERREKGHGKHTETKLCHSASTLSSPSSPTSSSSRLPLKVMILRTTWGYHLEVERFSRWLTALTSDGYCVLNSPKQVQWSTHKRYLHDLERMGGMVVPSAILLAKTESQKKEDGEENFHHMECDVSVACRKVYSQLRLYERMGKKLLHDAGAEQGIIIKPAVSASAHFARPFSSSYAVSSNANGRNQQTEKQRDIIQAKYAVDDLLQEAELYASFLRHSYGDVVVQPFLPHFRLFGEISMVFFYGGGRNVECDDANVSTANRNAPSSEVSSSSLALPPPFYSHSVCKVPATDEFRVQPEYGGAVRYFEPPLWMVKQAMRLLEAVQREKGPFLYARVDGVLFAAPSTPPQFSSSPLSVMSTDAAEAESEGILLVGELEMVEPELFIVWQENSETEFVRSLHAYLSDIVCNNEQHLLS